MTLPSAIIRTFRDVVWALSPPWLRRGLAQKILYSVAVQLDAGGDALNAGIKIRFPGVYSNESLSMIGQERRIRRGLHEEPPNYAARLTQWLVDHRVRGGAYAMLKQLWVHYYPENFPIVLWYPSGARYSLAEDGTITRFVPPVPLLTPKWASWSLLYFSDSFTAADETDLVLIPRDWNAAHCLGQIIVMPTDSELWDYPPDWLWNDALPWNSADSSIRMQVR